MNPSEWIMQLSWLEWFCRWSFSLSLMPLPCKYNNFFLIKFGKIIHDSMLDCHLRPPFLILTLHLDNISKDIWISIFPFKATRNSFFMSFLVFKNLINLNKTLLVSFQISKFCKYLFLLIPISQKRKPFKRFLYELKIWIQIYFTCDIHLLKARLKFGSKLYKKLFTSPIPLR